MQFKEWLSKTPEEIFGFGTQKTIQDEVESETPIERLSIGRMIDELVRLGGTQTKKPNRTWNGLIEYGSQLGAISVDVTPLGSVRAIIRKLTPDLQSETWICKKVIPITKMYHTPGNSKEIHLAHNIHESIAQIDKTLLDGPKAVYPEFERTVMAVAEAVRRNHPGVFIFEGVKKIDQYNYITHLSYRGHGVEAPGQTRCEQFHINTQFNKEKGLIKCWGNEITSPTKQHLWVSNTPEWSEWFAPTQDINEIIDCVVKSLSTY